MSFNILAGFHTYGVRKKVNLSIVGAISIMICLLTPCTNFMIPVIFKKCKGVVYV